MAAIRERAGPWSVPVAPMSHVAARSAVPSLIKGALRIIGTLLGGLVGMLIVIAFADEPQGLIGQRHAPD